MSRGGSYGGGQSSLGYLFGSEKDLPATTPPPAAAKPSPPYGVDEGDADEKPKMNIAVGNNNYHRAHGQNSGNFVTDRPTTKVKSVPGGGSSLGYLFGDK